MKFRKWLFRITGTLLLVGIIGACIAPYWLYRNQETILKTILDQVNANQIGHLEVGGSKISPFKQFPYISLEIDSIYFYGDGEERKDTIYFIEELYVGFDAWKILQGEYQIRELTIEGGFMDLITDSTGHINLLVAKSTGEEVTTADTSSLALDIQKLHIRDFRIDKTNEQLHHHFDFQIRQADFKLSYQPEMIESWLEAGFEIGDVSIENAHFLRQKDLDVHFHLFYDTEQGMVTLKESSFDLDHINMSLQGTVNTTDDMLLDLAIDGKKKNFDLLLAFAPDEVKEQASHYENEGDIYFHGEIKGRSALGMPRVDLEFGCDNAWFVHHGRSEKVEDLAFKGYFTLGDSATFETAELGIENLKAKPGKGQFKARMIRVKNFVHPQISVDLHAELNMATIRELLDVDELPQMDGRVTLDVVIDEFIDPNNMDAVSAKFQKGADSHLDFTDFSIGGIGLPFELKNLNGSVRMKDGNLVFEDFSMNMDESDLALDGSVSNVLAYIHRESAPMVVKLHTTSSKLNLEKLLATNADEAPIHDEITDLRFAAHFETTSDHLNEFKYLPHGEFFIDSLFCQLREFPHRFHDFHADILVDDHLIVVKDFHGEIDDTDFLLTAEAEGLDFLDRTDTIAPFRAMLDLKSDHLHFDDLMTYQGVNYLPETYQHEHLKSSEIMLHLNTTNRELQKETGLPNLTLELDDVHLTLSLHKSKFKNIHGKFEIKDDNLNITGFEGQLGKSDFHLDGTIENMMDTAAEMGYAVTFRSKYLDIDQLMDYKTSNEPASHDSVYNIFADPFPKLTAKLDIGEVTYHKFHFKQLYTEIRSTPDHYVYIDTAKAEGADGAFGIKGYFNGSDQTHIYLSSDLYMKEVDVDKLLFKFDNFGQDYLISENVHGKITAKIKSKVRLHPDLTPYLEETNAHADVDVLNGSIVNYAPLHAMAEYFADKNLDQIRFGKMSNTFDIKDGVLYIPRMTITSTLGYMDIKGQQATTGDMAMDYTLRIPLKMVRKASFDRVLRKNKGDDKEEDVIQEDPGKGLRIFIKVKGSADDYDIKIVKKKEIQKGEL